MAIATFEEKDQNRMNGSTTYWFELSNADYLDGTYGVVEGRNEGIVDDEGLPIDQDSAEGVFIRMHCQVTDEMRSE